MTSLTDAAWLQDVAVQTLLRALGQGEEGARVVGGAIRNHYLGYPITDVDIATTTLPRETMRLGTEAGFKAVPTGVDHGTVTLVRDGRALEVTTLRRDTESDGRHAKVAFGRDWKVDAERRDFTINALYADADGKVYDYVGGLADLEAQSLRFIGDAELRIREDYLRSLRFFRFFAWYGRGRPDAEALRATARLRDGLKTLSAERVWGEMKKLLSAPDPSRALLWMRRAGVLTAVLPETEKWGIDTIHPLVQAERDNVWDADPLLRLMAMIPPDGARVTEMARRLRLSNAERKRLQAFAMTAPVAADMPDSTWRATLQDGDRRALADRLRLDIAVASREPSGDVAAARLRLLHALETFEPAEFPIDGDDVQAAGVPAGKAVGQALARLRQRWLDSGLTADRETLLRDLRQEAPRGEGTDQ